MNRVRHLLVLTGFLILHQICWSQNDTVPSSTLPKPVVAEKVTDTLPAQNSGHRKTKKASPYAVDTFARRIHDPRKATLYSTFFPGLGQIYNHKYWKLPLVYAAVGIPVYTFFYNKGWYEKCQGALAIVDDYAEKGIPVPPDVINTVDPKLQYFVSTGNDDALRTYRNEFRKDQDYSIVFFLLAWGLQIVDATVDAHLKGFDISDELSMHLQQPSVNPMMPGTAAIGIGSTGLGATGLSLVFDLHKARYKPLLVP